MTELVTHFQDGRLGCFCRKHVQQINGLKLLPKPFANNMASGEKASVFSSLAYVSGKNSPGAHPESA
jgi:hypothetical protein